MGVEIINLITNETTPQVVPYRAVFDKGECVGVISSDVTTHEVVQNGLNSALSRHGLLDSTTIRDLGGLMKNNIEVKFTTPCDPVHKLYYAAWLMHDLTYKGTGKTYIYTGVVSLYSSSEVGQAPVFVLNPTRPVTTAGDHEEFFSKWLDASNVMWEEYVSPWFMKFKHPDTLRIYESLRKTLRKQGISKQVMDESYLEFQSCDGRSIWDLLVILSVMTDRFHKDDPKKRFDFRLRLNSAIQNELNRRI